MKKLYIKYVCILFVFIIYPMAFLAYAQYYQQADYGDISVTRNNQLGGYDYYDKSGNRVGYSKRTYSGDYIYYDNQGNKLGLLKQGKQKDSYTFYNVDNVAVGQLRKTPTGEYRYKDKIQGGLRSVTPPEGENIGFIPPSSFKENIFNSNLEGTFKKQQE